MLLWVCTYVFFGLGPCFDVDKSHRFRLMGACLAEAHKARVVNIDAFTAACMQGNGYRLHKGWCQSAGFQDHVCYVRD